MMKYLVALTLLAGLPGCVSVQVPVGKNGNYGSMVFGYQPPISVQAIPLPLNAKLTGYGK
jgi:hypothetical protein